MLSEYLQSSPYDRDASVNQIWCNVFFIQFGYIYIFRNAIWRPPPFWIFMTSEVVCFWSFVPNVVQISDIIAAIRRDTDSRSVAKFVEYPLLGSWQSLPGLPHKKPASRESSEPPPHFAPTRSIAPKISLTLSPLDLCTCTRFCQNWFCFAVVSPERLTIRTPSVYSVDWKAIWLSPYNNTDIFDNFNTISPEQFH